MTKHLTTVEQVILELGGVKAVAKLVGSETISLVPTWQWRGRFPARTVKVLQSALHKVGASAPDCLWGMQ